MFLLLHTSCYDNLPFCVHSDNLCLLSAIGTAVSVDWSSVLVKPSKSCVLLLCACACVCACMRVCVCVTVSMNCTSDLLVSDTNY